MIGQLFRLHNSIVNQFKNVSKTLKPCWEHVIGPRVFLLSELESEPEVRSNRRGQLSSLVLVQYTVTVLYQMWWQLQNQNDFPTAFWDDEKHWRSPRKPILSSLSFLLFPLRPLVSPSWVFTLLSSEFSS